MVNTIIQLSKYACIFLFAIYTYRSFSVLTNRRSMKVRKRIYRLQLFEILLLHFLGFLDLYLVYEKDIFLIFYLVQVLFILLLRTSYRVIYKDAPATLVNNMCMLLVISLIMLTRLNPDLALRQFEIAVISYVLCLCIPLILKYFQSFENWSRFYAISGLLLLGIVLVAGAVSFGAKLSFTIAGVTVQPSEFVKIIFVFYVASTLHKATEVREIFLASVVAAIHVLILVASRDLGTGLIFFVVYLIMLFVATRNVIYLIGGFLGGAMASVGAYFMFSHVRTRVIAWMDPVGTIDDSGYQVCQSLFAIGTGGWFGTGLTKGYPNSIPVVEQDFIFSAIAEEMGGFFALCLIMVCVSNFLVILNVAMQMREEFFKLIALGLGTCYIFQVFLTIGGATKFIPSTGVTLPLVSSGGSSLLSTFVLFNIIQALYLIKRKEGAKHERKANEIVFETEIETFE